MDFVFEINARYLQAEQAEAVHEKYRSVWIMCLTIPVYSGKYKYYNTFCKVLVSIQVMSESNTNDIDHGGTDNTDRRTFMGALGAMGSGAAIDIGLGDRFGGSNQGLGVSDPKNLILFIPDGGGQTQDTAARYYRAYEKNPEAFPLNINTGMIEDVEMGIDQADIKGSMSTYPDDPDGQLITDSAAAGTAMSTGYKTYSGAVSVDHAGRPIETILEKANDAGYATGLVTTTQMTHATPATFGAHVESRGMQEEIARQYIQEQDIDVLLGGDRSHFSPEDRSDGQDLIAQAEWQGYEYVTTKDGLESVSGGKVLGLFSESGHLDYYIDRLHNPDNTQPGLELMTEVAISILQEQSDRGFFLMVEGGRVDHYGHANDPAMIPEQVEHDYAVEVGMDYADETDNTLVVNVADHETGGLSLSRDSYYMDWDPIVNQEVSQWRIAEELEDAISIGEVRDTIEEYTGIDDLSDDEAAELINDPNAIRGRDSVINERAGLAWGTDAHSAQDVPIYAKGPSAEYFKTGIDNTELMNGFTSHLDI